MKQNFYNKEERKKYIEFINSVRNNTDIPRIYLPFVCGTSEEFSPITGCNTIDINNKVIVAIKVILKDNITDKEKRDRVKELINDFIDYAFDTYEIYKEEIGINNEAKINRKEEVKKAKNRISNNKTYNKLSWLVGNLNNNNIEANKEELKDKSNLEYDFPIITDINDEPVIVCPKTKNTLDVPFVIYQENDKNKENKEEEEIK